MTGPLNSAAPQSTAEVRAAAPATSGYSTTVGDAAADAEKILALWRTGLDHNGMPKAKLDWYYLNNPEGVPLTVFLHHTADSEAVGVAAAGRRQMRLGGKEVSAGELVDFVTVPDHRTFFPAISLQQDLRRIAHTQHAVLFGFPNPKSLAIVKRIGYRCVGQVVRRVRVLRSSAYLEKYLPAGVARPAGALIDHLRVAAMAFRSFARPGSVCAWHPAPDSTFDELWNRSVDAAVLTGLRNAAFLKWRFVDTPFESFRFFTAVSTADRRLLGYAVCSRDENVMRVDDFLVDPHAGPAGRKLWRDLSREAFREGCTTVAVEFMGTKAQERQLIASGFISREHRPIYASIDKDQASAPTETTCWYLTAADKN
ncbi:MAG: hypothetical protein ABI905_00960 [Betaproteobacteria bacterium]